MFLGCEICLLLVVQYQIALPLFAVNLMRMIQHQGILHGSRRLQLSMVRSHLKVFPAGSVSNAIGIFSYVIGLFKIVVHQTHVHQVAQAKNSAPIF